MKDMWKEKWSPQHAHIPMHIRVFICGVYTCTYGRCAYVCMHMTYACTYAGGMVVEGAYALCIHMWGA